MSICIHESLGALHGEASRPGGEQIYESMVLLSLTLSLYIYLCRASFLCISIYVYTYPRVAQSPYGEAYAPVGECPTRWIGIHVFLGRSHKNTNNVFRLVRPVYNIDMYIFKVTVFKKTDLIWIEYRTLFCPPRIQHVGWAHLWICGSLSFSLSLHLWRAVWPLREIAITNVVWCKAYRRRVGGRRILRNRRAAVLQ